MRRLLFPLALALLSVPLLVLVATPPARGVSADELRPLAPPPRLAVTRMLPTETDAWLRDHFGLRRVLIHAQAWLVHGVLGAGTAEVLIGPTGRPFLRENRMVAQSAGRKIDHAGVIAAADMLATLRDSLALQGATLLVAPPPNASSIDAKDLPVWARNPGRATEYDLLLEALAARGVAAVDLRPVMRTLQQTADPYRRTDSHWTPQASLAAFNAIVDAAGLPGWRLAADAALTPPLPLSPGDLDRMLNLTGAPWEAVRMPALPAGTEHPLDATEWGAFERAIPGRDGPAIVVIGDSFTRTLMPPLVLAHTGRVAWLHHEDCGFDFAMVARLHPAQVWYMPTERRIACAPGRYPAGLPVSAALASTGASAR